VGKALEAAVPGKVVVGSSTWPHIANMFEANVVSGGHMEISGSLMGDNLQFEAKQPEICLPPYDVLLGASNTLEQYCHEGARCVHVSCMSVQTS
jgi:hypothetical protein